MLRPRQGGITANANATKYSPEQVEMFKQMYRDNLIYFGYVEHPTETNPLAFFKFDDLT